MSRKRHQKSGFQDPAEALPTKVASRLRHAGQWVAWNPQETEIVAAGDDPSQVRANAEQLGYRDVILDWIDPLSPGAVGNNAS